MTENSITVTDTEKKYLTKYTTFEPVNGVSHIQKVVSVLGQAGKQIRLDAVSLFLAAEGGVTASAKVVAVTDGKETKLGEWSETNVKFQKKASIETVLAAAGKSIELQYHLKGSDKTGKYRACMKLCSYTYSLLDAEITVPDVPSAADYLVTVTCTEDEATKLANDLKPNYTGVGLYGPL
jgi:hypothetical protein